MFLDMPSAHVIDEFGAIRACTADHNLPEWRLRDFRMPIVRCHADAHLATIRHGYRSIRHQGTLRPPIQYKNSSTGAVFLALLPCKAHQCVSLSVGASRNPVIPAFAGMTEFGF